MFDPRLFSLVGKVRQEKLSRPKYFATASTFTTITWNGRRPHCHLLMPRRPASLAQRWSIYDLPIPPFLAPRVFQPWPSTRGGRRNYSTSQPAERNNDEQESSTPVTVVEEGGPSEGGEGSGWAQSNDGPEYAPILPGRAPRKRGSNTQSIAKGPARFRDPKLIHKDGRLSR